MKPENTLKIKNFDSVAGILFKALKNSTSILIKPEKK